VDGIPRTEFKPEREGTDVIKRMKNQVAPPDSIQNLNAKLSPRPERTRGDRPAARPRTGGSSTPPPRIVGAKSRYQGGYCINV
jgi:hypothetical protein